MLSKITQRSYVTQIPYLKLLQEGNERGLAYCYRLFFKSLYFGAYKAVKDDCVVTSIVQEAFLRLWLCREQLHHWEEVLDFLRSQVYQAINRYFGQSETRFQRSLLRIDGIEDADDFLLGVALEEEQEIAVSDLEAKESEKALQLKRLATVLPNLNQQQQLFIRLCLKFSFNYERIAYHLGGLSDYEVALNVEQTIAQLRQIFQGTAQLTQLSQAPLAYSFEGEFSKAQQEVFRLRYQLQYSFEQIAAALSLDENKVRQLFVTAHAQVKPKKTNQWKR